ncbi:MAG: hypothetical protein AAFW65_04550 [Pseudomonadota bacterium]
MDTGFPMLHPSTKKLIDRLREKTAQQAITWTEGEDQALVFDTEGYRVALTDAPIEVVLLDPLGKELERATQQDLAATQTADGQSYADALAGMRGDAQRIARGAEYAIERVLAGLEKSEDANDAAAIATEATAPNEADELPTITDETSLLAERTTSDVADAEAAPQQLAEEVESSAPAMPESPAPALRQREEPVPAESATGVEVPLTSIGAVAGFSGTVQVEETQTEEMPAVDPAPEPDVLPVIEDHVAEAGPSSEDALASELLSQVVEQVTASEASAGSVTAEAVDEANDMLSDPFASIPHVGEAPETASPQPEPAPEAAADAETDEEGKVKTTTRFNPWN